MYFSKKGSDPINVLFLKNKKMKKFILLFATAFIIFAAQAQTQRTVQGIVRNDLKLPKALQKQLRRTRRSR